SPALDTVAAYSWRLLVTVAAVAVVVYALVVLRLVVIPIFIAVLLATLLVPLAERLRTRGVPSLVATWLVFVGAIGAVVALVSVLAPQVADQLDDLGQDVREGAEAVVTWLVDGPLDLSRNEIDRYIDQVSEQLQERRSRLISGAFRGAYLLVEVIAGLLLTLVLTFFFVKDGDQISNALVGLFPRDRRTDVRAIGRRAWEALGAYMRGTALVGVVDATAIGLALLILGVPLVLPLAIITFFGAFFPLVGAVVAGIVATLVALVTKGFVAALILVGVTIAIQQIEGDVLQPIVLGRAVKLHPVMILLSITAGAIVAGVAGAFLAVPIAAVTSASVAYVRGKGEAT
ncbi:MAG: AI-2E family transporter, partial [Actinobacteria bacterium]|nr:AI-2E family transporter [Actinomycetota bacterium]